MRVLEWVLVGVLVVATLWAIRIGQLVLAVLLAVALAVVLWRVLG